MGCSVSLIAESFRDGRPVGTARYARELAARMPDAQLVEVGESKYRGEFFMRSLLNRLRRPVGEVIHALDPSFFVRRKGRKSVATFHDLMHRGSEMSMLVYRRAAEADALIAVSSQTAEQLEALFDVKATVVNEGVSECFRFDPHVARSPYSLLYVGDVNPRKRLEYLVEAFTLLHKSVKDARLTFIGKPVADFNGPYEKRLMEMCHAFDLNGAVRFVGYVNDPLLDTYLNQARALILPSDEEGFGLPILEAQACGCPVIVRKDALIPKETRKLCIEAGSPEEMAEAMARCIGEEPDRRALSDYAGSFTWERCAQETTGVYQSI